MRNKRLITILLAVLLLLPVNAVLKEKDLARTLSVLKLELKADYEKQQVFKEMHEKQSATQHQQLISFMQKCEQTALILYSQNSEYTFDMAYACQQATDLYRNLKNNTRPYEQMRTWAEHEITRYDELIKALKRLPPVSKSDEDEVLTAADSIISQAVDSLETIKLQMEAKADSIASAAADSAKAAAKQGADSATIEAIVEEIVSDTVRKGPTMGPTLVDEEELITEPYILNKQQQLERQECLLYAEAMKANLEEFLQGLILESTYYEAVNEKAKELNDYAQLQYSTIRNNIFRNAGGSYFTILGRLPFYMQRANSTFNSKYMPFEEHEHDFSEWRGSQTLFTGIFMLFYILAAAIVSTVIVRLLLINRYIREHIQQKVMMINASLGAVLFAISVMVVQQFATQNFFLMSTQLMILFAWLLVVIFLSFLIRLDARQTRNAIRVYIPFIIVAYIVIIFRIMLIPNIIVNLVFPPLMLICTTWQMLAMKHCKDHLPKTDMFYGHISSMAMIVALCASWLGYTLLAVQLMIWWMFQLAAIQSITCIYDLIKMYETRFIALRIDPTLKGRIRAGENVANDLKKVLTDMSKGHYISRTWGFDFVRLCAVPIMAVTSVFLSIWWASRIFEMTSLYRQAFLYKFVNEPDLMQLSLAQLCLVAALWFAFRYITYALRGFYRHYHNMLGGDIERANFTLANNVIAILFWGIYCIVTLVILRIPKSGISVVSAGLATGMGFAMKDLLENFFYGISLMTGRVHVGDYIECDGIQGKVESITYQSTQLATADGCVIAFLNSDLFSKNFKNLTRNHRYELVKLPIGVAYGCDVEMVRQRLVEAITPLCHEKNAEGESITDTSQPVKVSFVDFGASSVDLAVCIWMLVEEKRALSARVKEVIYNTLNAHHIEIPFPQCDVHIIQ